MSNVVRLPTPENYDHNARPPAFILPVTADELTDEQMDHILEHIRTVRLVAHHRFNETKKVRNAAATANLSVRYDKCMHNMMKELDKLDKYLDKLTKVSNDLRALRLQLGVDPL
jgi:hypothetical protein